LTLRFANTAKCSVHHFTRHLLSCTKVKLSFTHSQLSEGSFYDTHRGICRQWHFYVWTCLQQRHPSVFKDVLTTTTGAAADARRVNCCVMEAPFIVITRFARCFYVGVRTARPIVLQICAYTPTSFRVTNSVSFISHAFENQLSWTSLVRCSKYLCRFRCWITLKRSHLGVILKSLNFILHMLLPRGLTTNLCYSLIWLNSMVSNNLQFMPLICLRLIVRYEFVLNFNWICNQRVHLHLSHDVFVQRCGSCRFRTKSWFFFASIVTSV
jgi:hypothetical protein